MYHQVLGIGESDENVVIEYGIDEDCGVLWIESMKSTDGKELLGYFLEYQLKPIEQQLWKRHDSVVREMDWLHGESVAAERAAFKEAYA